jgi:DNA gyrase subunit B/topoisomerase-4 subunit B
MSFKRGKVTGPLKSGRRARHWTSVYFHPDSTIFPKVEFDPALIRERLEVVSYIHKGVRVTFDNELDGKKEVFEHREGLLDFLKKILAERSAKPVHDAPFVQSRDTSPRLDLVLQWTEATDEHLRSYVNGIPTGSGGTHETVARRTGEGGPELYDTHNLSPKGDADCRRHS